MLTEPRSTTEITEAPSEAPPAPRPHPVLRTTAYLAAAWAVPALAHYIGVDFVLPVVIWLAAASLLRIGSTLLDRLIPALGLTCGAIMLGGYLTSYWPWGLSPIPVAGTALTVAVIAGAATGRRPSLPRRLLGTDALVAGAGVVSTLLVAAPTLATKNLGWTAYAAITGDRLRQFNLFDTIRHIGGYPALHPDAAAPILESTMLPAYPPGMHYVLSVVDAFVTGSDSDGTGLEALQRYHWYVTIGYGLLVLTVAWAARWIAGPQAAGWKRALAVTATAGFTATGIPTAMVWEGFDAQIVGLAFLILLIGVLARPPKSLGEQLLLAGALTVAATYTYTLYAVFAAIALIATAVVRRSQIRRQPVLTAVAAGFFAVATSLQFVIPYLGGFDGTNHLNATGFILPTPKGLLYTTLALAAIALVTPNVRRSPRLQILAAISAGGLLFAIGLHAYNVAYIGTGSYYYEKTLQALVLILIVAAPAALRHLRAPDWWTGGRAARLARTLTASTAAVLATLVVLGVLPPTANATYNGAAYQPGTNTNWIDVWGAGKIHASISPALQYLNDNGYVGDGVHTQVVFTPNGGNNQQLTLLLSMLNRDLGGLYRQIYGVELKNLVGHDPATPLDADSQASLDLYKLVVTESKVPLRVLTNDTYAYRVLTEFAATGPGTGLTVVYLPDMPGEGPPQQN